MQVNTPATSNTLGREVIPLVVDRSSHYRYGQITPPDDESPETADHAGFGEEAVAAGRITIEPEERGSLSKGNKRRVKVTSKGEGSGVPSKRSRKSSEAKKAARDSKDDAKREKFLE